MQNSHMNREISKDRTGHGTGTKTKEICFYTKNGADYTCVHRSLTVRDCTIVFEIILQLLIRF